MDPAKPALCHALAASRLVNGFDQVLFGFQHESNGQDKPASRSWNFVYVEQRFVQFLGTPSKSTPVLRAYFKLWLVPFGTKDNPDVLDFAGPGEVIVDLTSGHSRLGVWELELLARKGGLNADFRRGKIQVGVRWQPNWFHWARFTPGFYAQGFFGYMESLETYDIYQNSIRVGVVFPG